jgi:predicted peroxiredoxin
MVYIQSKEMNFEKLKLTKEQMKAVKKVERALKEATKLGVKFWEDYGNLVAYNDNAIH